ncbi:sulfotransferase [Plakobranchus ocellatus]|uniref:Sulfotransferase n=1 Tax=Plakobranchus ocellatus TaxID=259542 RepID=A0AAV4BI51_9GAST|nr:sulfotransferase [Plakobranchus ocellatus]
MLARYEDIVHSPIEAMEQIYNFASINFRADIQKRILRMSKNKNRPYTWREKIGAERASIVENNCGILLRTMGYRIFPDQESIMDKSFLTVEDNFAIGWPGKVDDDNNIDDCCNDCNNGVTSVAVVEYQDDDDDDEKEEDDHDDDPISIINYEEEKHTEKKKEDEDEHDNNFKT